MKLKLLGHVSRGSGRVNEDAAGYLGAPDDIQAAWVLDGVTGINDQSLGLADSDAQWFVARIDAHLRELLPQAGAVQDVMSELVDRLIREQAEAFAQEAIVDGFDPPAACIAAICRLDGEWHAFRLGDCRLLAQDGNGLRRLVDFPNDDFDHWVTAEATRLREAGVTELDDLFRALQPAHFAARRQRNRPDGYGVIEADRACLAFIEQMTLDRPVSVMLASDGFFRLVDHYHELSEAALLTRAQKDGGVRSLYDRLRAIEESDPQCRRFPRLKPKDDASAIALA